MDVYHKMKSKFADVAEMLLKNPTESSEKPAQTSVMMKFLQNCGYHPYTNDIYEDFFDHAACHAK